MSESPHSRAVAAAEEEFLTMVKVSMAQRGEFAENIAFREPGTNETVFSDSAGCCHFRASTIEKLHARRCVSIQGPPGSRVARLCS